MSQIPSNPSAPGGISYVINVGGNLPEALDRLSLELNNVTNRLDTALASLQSYKAKAVQANKAVATSTDQLAQSNARAAAATEAATKATAAATSGSKLRERAIKAENKALDQQALARERANVEAERDFQRTSKRASANQQLLSANKELNKALEQRFRNERLLDQIQRRRLTLSEDELVRLGLASKVKPVGAGEKAQVAAGLASPSGLATDIKALTSAQAGYDKAVAQTTPDVRRLRDDTAALTLAERARAAELQSLTRAQIAAAAAEKQAANTQLQALVARQRIAKARFDQGVQSQVDAALNPVRDAGSGRGNDFLRRVLGLGDNDDKRINTVLRSIERLVAAVLVLKAIRFAFSGFDTVVKDSIQFNAELERAKIGIAAIIVGAGQIRDITGEQVKGAHAFALAQVEAAKQLRLIRIDALNTVASIDKLIETFQTAIGPGLAAGLNLDQVRKFSVQISQAATAIGLEQGQLAEEIRSILTATINTRQTRIATVLGLTNDDIRRAKEAGSLADLLSRKFAAFNLAGEQLGSTFEGALNRVKSALLSLGSEASLGVFNELKALFQDVAGLLVTIDKEAGDIRINPGFRTAAEAFFESIQNIVKSARQLVSTIDFAKVTASARQLGQAIKAVYDITIGLIRGVASAFATIQNVLSTLLSAFTKIPLVGSIFDGASLQETVALLSQIFIGFKLIRGVALVIPGIIRAISVATAAWNLALALVSKGLVGLRLGIYLVQLAWRALDLTIRRSVLGLTLAIGSLVAIFALEKFGLLGSLTDKVVGSEKELSDKAKQVRALRDELFGFYNELPSQVLGASESLKEQESVITNLRREFEQLNIERERSFLRLQKTGQTTPSASLTGFAQEASRIALDAILSVQEKTRAVENDRRQNAEAIKGALQQQAEAQTRLLAVARDSTAEEAKVLAFKARVLADTKRLREAQERVGATSVAELNAPDLRTVQAIENQQQGILAAAVKESAVRKDILTSTDQILQIRRRISQQQVADQQAAAGELKLLRQQREQANADLGLLAPEDNRTRINSGALKAARAEVDRINALIAKAQAALTADSAAVVEFRSEEARQVNIILDTLQASRVPEQEALRIQQDLLELAQQRQVAEARIRSVLESQNGEQEKITARTRENLIEARRALLADIADSQSRTLTEILPGADNAEARQRVLSAVRASLEAEAKTVGFQERQNVLLQAQVALQREVNQAANVKLAIAAQNFVFEQRRTNELDRLRADAAAAEAAVRRANDAEKALVAARNTTKELRLQAQLAQQIRSANLQAAQSNISSLIDQLASLRESIGGSRTAGPDDRSSAFLERPQDEQVQLLLKAKTAQDALTESTRAYGALLVANNIARDTEAQKIKTSTELQEEARIRADSGGATFAEKLVLAAETLNETLPSKFEQIFNTLSTIVDGFSSFASDAIVDAFDPTKKVDLKERFARFLQDVARQIIQQLVQIAVTKAALGLSTGLLSLGLATGGEVRQPQGFRHGGMARRGATRHRVRGFAQGGDVAGPSLPHLRPAGIDRRDTVPAWLQVGEFVQPLHAVMAYGSDLMEAFRQRMIDPREARSLLPGNRARQRSRDVSSRAVRSYAAGGGVTAARPAPVSRPAAASAADSAPVVVPAVVASESTMDQLVRGGGTSLIRFLDENGFVRQ